MPYFSNSRGKLFRYGTGGCYPINDGDPQNDDPEFDCRYADDGMPDVNYTQDHTQDLYWCGTKRMF